MNFDRIRPTLDVDRMQQSHVTIVGGAYGLPMDPEADCPDCRMHRSQQDEAA